MVTARLIDEASFRLNRQGKAPFVVPVSGHEGCQVGTAWPLRPGRDIWVPYYRDVYDALFHISELAQNYTDSLTGILQVYLNMSSNQTGEVIKVLTLFTIVTTPMMLVGTWYGMNFEHMPELKPQGAYGTIILITVLSTAVTFLYFKKKKWL